MGLRQLYFLLGGLLDRLVYLSHRPGRGARLHRREAGAGGAARQQRCRSSTAASTSAWAPQIPIWLSLTVILGTLAIATVASLVKRRGAFSADEPVIEPEEAQQIAGRGPEAAAGAEGRIKEQVETEKERSDRDNGAPSARTGNGQRRPSPGPT